jgi:uncharacterized membrane protein YdfJ with MMPL/SSD domain
VPGITPAQWAAFRVESQFISPDGRTVLFDAGLAAGDPASNAALHQVPAIRAAVAAVAHRVGAREYGVTGQAPAAYDVSRASDRDLLLIVPVAIVALLGRWNWWPSRHGTEVGVKPTAEPRSAGDTTVRSEQMVF